MNETNDDKFERELLARARELGTDVQPDRDLWPGIAEAIAPPAPRMPAWNRYLAQAAAVVLLVGGSSALTWLAVEGDRASPTPAPAVATGGLRVETADANFGSRYTLGPDFVDARMGLESRLDEGLERLSPETRADVEENVATIRAAIREINAALADDPDNVLLQELLLNSYRKELSLMRNVNSISGAVMYREDM